MSVILQGVEPRWIILGNASSALPVLRSWWPFKLQSQVKWSLVILACSINQLSRLPGVACKTISLDRSYWHRWLPDYSPDCTAVIHIGNASHTRKAILFLVGNDARVRAVVKVPLTQQAGGAILNEATILRHLHSTGDLPQVLFEDRDHGIAAQTWLEGKAVARPFRQGHLELLSRLARPDEFIRLSDCLEPIAKSLENLDLPIKHSHLRHALDLLDIDSALPAFVEHRDFAPWNLKRLEDGRLTLLDWEWAVEKSLPWQDICRFFYIQDFLFRGSGRVWETLVTNPHLQTYLHRFGIQSSAVPGLTMHYLLRSLSIASINHEARAAEYTMRQIETVLGASTHS